MTQEELEVEQTISEFRVEENRQITGELSECHKRIEELYAKIMNDPEGLEEIRGILNE